MDVHKLQVTVTVLLEQSDGPLQESTREFGTFRADRLALAEWLNSLNVERIVMESTGIYWRSIFSTLEAAGLKAHSVNARHVKQVPGRKTDVKGNEAGAKYYLMGVFATAVMLYGMSLIFGVADLMKGFDFIVAVIGAVIVLFVYRMIATRKRKGRRGCRAT